MGSVSERLRKQAEVRTCDVQVGDETFKVREVSSLTFKRYGETVKLDRILATSYLLEECVLDENGAPALSAEDAAFIASSPRVVVPLVSAIMELSGLGGDEKKPDAS